MVLRDIMSTNVVKAKPLDSILSVAQKMKEANVGCVPVVENDELVGIITDRDITIRVTAAGLNPADQTVETFMNTRPVSATPEMSVQDAIDFMGEKGIRRLPVLEKGKLIGVVSIDDIAYAFDDKEAVGWALSSIARAEGLRKVAKVA
jgi:CBS domain-containing protein